MRTYLDWNATAPLREEARSAMAAAMDIVGNPSSVHAEGRRARSIVEQARGQVAAAVGAQPRNVIFTSGGSEANALALSRAVEVAGSGPCDGLLVCAIEHVSVLAGGDYGTVHRFSADRNGVACLDDLRGRIASLQASGVRRPLVALMAANNENGVIQPVAEAAATVHAAGGLLHVDAVQALGKLPLAIGGDGNAGTGADLMALSAHKIGGPAGVGALVLGHDRLHFRPSRLGGGQERNRRGGTENVIGIAGFGAAIAAAGPGLAATARLAQLRAHLENGLKEIWPDTMIFGQAVGRIANTSQFAVAGLKAQTALMALDLEGIAVSSGSACSSGTMRFSAVVQSLGFSPELAEGAVRVSIGTATTSADLDRFLGAWRKLLQPLLIQKRVTIAA